MLKHRHFLSFLAVAAGSVCLLSAAAAAQSPAEKRALARDIFKELIEIDTTDSNGNTTIAARAMAQRLRDAGFAAADITVVGPNDRKGNLVARYRGKPGSKLRPVLIIGHLDVVEARREDWSTDPFRFLEKDGYFYGRGTQDMKASDAIMVADFIRLKHDGFVPARDLILALTADEEGGTSNGVSWLLDNRRDLVDAEYVLNPESSGVVTDHGRPLTVEVVATEKLYGDYQVMAVSPGGHSSLPTADNAIYRVTDALAALQKSPFPVELNSVTREYFARMAATETGATAADLRAVLATPPDAAAAARLSAYPRYNATLRTTCVPTLMSAGHASNALPQRAEANVNCRILPGHSQEEVRLELARIFNDPTLTVRYRGDGGELLEHGSDRKAIAPPPLRPDVMDSLRSVAGRFWPGAAVVPIMMMWASDSVHTMMAGIPSYGISGVAVDRDDVRMHGRDERVGVESFYTGVDFYYEFLVKLTSRR